MLFDIGEFGGYVFRVFFEGRGIMFEILGVLFDVRMVRMRETLRMVRMRETFFVFPGRGKNLRINDQIKGALGKGSCGVGGQDHG